MRHRFRGFAVPIEANVNLPCLMVPSKHHLLKGIVDKDISSIERRTFFNWHTKSSGRLLWGRQALLGHLQATIFGRTRSKLASLAGRLQKRVNVHDGIFSLDLFPRRNRAAGLLYQDEQSTAFAQAVDVEAFGDAGGNLGLNLSGINVLGVRLVDSRVVHKPARRCGKDRRPERRNRLLVIPTRFDVLKVVWHLHPAKVDECLVVAESRRSCAERSTTTAMRRVSRASRPLPGRTCQ